MSVAYHVHLASLLMALAIIQGIQAYHTLQYTFTNNAKHTNGGRRFESEIGEESAKSMLKLATKHIWVLFGQYWYPKNREQVKQIHLSIDEMGETSTSEINNEIGEIHISANHIASCKNEYLIKDVSDIIYYELTHILQSKAKGQIPIALKDGIAAYVVLILNDKEPMGWVKFGGGDRWDESPDVTAQFLKFCCGLNPIFVRSMNAKMKNSYDDKYFVELTGRDISTAWEEYKNKWGNHA